MQASGKSRRIDNGKRSLTNAATGYSETFTMNTACAPAVSAGALGAGVAELGVAESVQLVRDLESGGEDIRVLLLLYRYGRVKSDLPLIRAFSME